MVTPLHMVSIQVYLAVDSRCEDLPEAAIMFPRSEYHWILSNPQFRPLKLSDFNCLSLPQAAWPSLVKAQIRKMNCACLMCRQLLQSLYNYDTTCLNRPLKKKTQIGFQDRLSHNALVKSIVEWEHSAILSTFIKLPFDIKIFVLSIFEWLFYTGFTKITVYSFASIPLMFSRHSNSI